MRPTQLLCVCALAALLVVPGAAPARGQIPAASDTLTVERVRGAGRVETAVALSQALFEDADTVVLAAASAFPDALVAAPLAAARSGPILLTDSGALPPVVSDELARLDANHVVLLGGEDAISEAVEDALAEDYQTRRVSGSGRFETAVAVAGELDATETVFLVNGDQFPDALAVAPLAASGAHPLLLVAHDHVPPPTAAALDELRPREVVIVGGEAVVTSQVQEAVDTDDRNVRRISGSNRFETSALLYDEMLAAGFTPEVVWLAAAGNFPDALVAGAAAGQRREPFLLVDGTDLFRSRAPAHRLTFRRDVLEHVRLLGGTDALHAGAADEVRELTHPGAHLPGGARVIFPRYRLVGYYGSALTPAMGVLGEGTPDEAGQRLLQQARMYATAQRDVLPVFELITTVATRSPGEDGDYSAPADPQTVQRYLDAARRVGALLLLDFQPGRSRFLPQVREYEAFLKEPEVGVALDPEWRMGPDQRPGDTIGSVTAAEINEVSAYVSDVVAAHDLPQKLFVVHQFRHDMVHDKPEVQGRNGLAMSFHIDGFGTRSQKLQTYHAITSADERWWNGLKLFFDEDTNMFAPHEVLELTPVPDLVTYQ